MAANSSTLLTYWVVKYDLYQLLILGFHVHRKHFEITLESSGGEGGVKVGILESQMHIAWRKNYLNSISSR